MIKTITTRKLMKYLHPAIMTTRDAYQLPPDKYIKDENKITDNK